MIFFQSVEPRGEYQQPDSSVLLTKLLMTSGPIFLILQLLICLDRLLWWGRVLVTKDRGPRLGNLPKPDDLSQFYYSPVTHLA